MKKKKPQQQVRESMELENETVQDFTGNIGIGDVPRTPILDTRADSGQILDEFTVQDTLQPKEGKVVPSIFSQLEQDELMQLLSGIPEIGVGKVSPTETDVIYTKEITNRFGRKETVQVTATIYSPITYQKVFRLFIYLGTNLPR